MARIKDKIERQNKEEYAYKKMLDFGWQPHQASAIVGNLKRESNFNTTIVGTADDKGSQGLAQWHSGRLDNLKKKYGANWTDFDNQLEFVNWELNNSHKKAGDALRQAKGVWDAGRVVTNQYEAPKVKWDRDEKRQNYVTDVYRKYSGVKLTEEDKTNFLRGTAQRAIDSYNNTQKITPTVTDLAVPEQSVNLATVPETAEESEDVAQATQKLQQKQAEENFLTELYTQREEQPVVEVAPQRQMIQQPSVLDRYAQIESFVDSPVAQQGGSIEADNEWLKNWYQNRVIPDPRLQELYLEDKPFYSDRLKSIPKVTNVDIIGNDINRTGQYQSDTNKILLTPRAQPSVYTHETNHYINAFPSAMRTVHENIVNQSMYKKEDPRLGVNAPYYEYLRNPDEIHSRIQVLRKDAGFKPDEKVTHEKLMKYLQNYTGDDDNILQIMNLTDDKGLLNMLNTMADNSKKPNVNYAQQGGKIELKDSKIEGKGIFTTDKLQKGDFIGLAHTNGQPSTELGRFHNHSENPNSESVLIGSNRYIVTKTPIKKGEEITVDYRQQPELEQPEDFKNTPQLTEKEKSFLKLIKNNYNG